MKTSFQWKRGTDNKQENAYVRWVEILVKAIKTRNKNNGEFDTNRAILFIQNSPCNWFIQRSFKNSRSDMIRNIF